MVRPVVPIHGTALALPLVVYAMIGSFARYTADDYCWAGVLRAEGFLNAQVLWYTGYSPRYAFTFLVNLVELAGPPIVPVLPLVTITVWLATFAWTFAQFGVRGWQAIVLAELMVFATLQTAPDLPQSLYWQTGMLTYLLPLVLAAFLIGGIRRAWCAGRVSLASTVVSGVVTFVAGGLSETYLIPQNVALTLALALCLRFTRQTTRRVLAAQLGAALAGGVLALLAILLAPATTYRVGGTPADLWLASAAAVATGTGQALHLTRYFPLTTLLCLALPTVLGIGPRRTIVTRKWFWLVTACAVVTLPFCYFPSFYAQNGNPPARSLIVPGAIMVGYLVFVGLAVAGRIGRWMPEPRRVVAAVALAVVPIGSAVVTLPEAALAAQHAALWDAEDAQIRASRDAGQTDVTVPPLPRYLGEEFVTPNRDDWFNVCVARYYGVRSIASAS